MSKPTNDHLSPGQIMEAARSKLSDIFVDRHLATCSECRNSVQEWRETITEFAPLRDPLIDRATKDCPSLDKLGNYCAGVGEKREELRDHIARCERCATILSDVMEAGEGKPIPGLRSSTPTWRRQMAAQFGRSTQTHPSSWRSYAAIAAALLLVAGTALWWSRQRTPDPDLLLAQAYTQMRPFEYRLPDRGYSPVRQKRGTDSAFRHPSPLISAETEIQRRLASHPEDPALLLLKGRADLLERDYEAAIEALTRAQELKPNDPEVLIALGTAYAVRGDTEGRNMDLGHALDVYLKAVKIQPADQRLLFNLALVYQRLSMVEEAVQTWHKLLSLNPPAEWRHEADDQLKILEKIQHGKTKADRRVLHDPSDFLKTYGPETSFDPLSYYEIFWAEWLPRSFSNSAFRGAAEIVANQMRKNFGDRSLQATLVGVHGVATSEAVRLLGQTIIENRRGRAEAAISTARTAISALEAAGLHAAANRARVELAYASRWAANDAGCVVLTQRVLRETPRSQAWLLGSSHLEHSACLAGLGQSDMARAEIEQTYAKLSKTGIWPVALRALGFLTGLDGYTGNYGPIWENAPQGLRVYWTTAASLYRAQNFQFDLETASKLSGWSEGAVAFYGAAIRSAHRAGNYEMEVRDRFDLAGLFHEMGDARSELQELQKAGDLLRSLEQRDAPANGVLQNLLWESRLRSAEARVVTNRPSDAVQDLALLQELSSGRGVTEQMRVAQARGLALMTIGDLPRAAQSFRQAIALNQKRASGIPSWVDRIPVLETAAASYRGLAQIQLQDGEGVTAALQTWRSFRCEAGDKGDITITMALLPRGIAIWRSGEGETTARWVEAPVSAVLLASQTLRRLSASPRSDEQEIRRLGNQLYQWLLGPELQYAKPGPIRVNADSWLAGIPLGVLTDHTGSYALCHRSFVETYGSEPARAVPVDQSIIRDDERALIVAAPSAIAPGQVLLPFLSAAMPEAYAVAEHFRNATLITAATPERLWAELPRSTVFHFVGHGWANGGGGAILLPATRDGQAGFIASRNLSEHDWSHCRLAVLSACLTATGAERGTVNNESLVQSLLGAGAQRVVAARWSVDSDATRVLMEGFYRCLLAGVPVSEALARSAVDVSRRPEWKHPFYWSAFEVFGRV